MNVFVGQKSNQQNKIEHLAVSLHYLSILSLLHYKYIFLQYPIIQPHSNKLSVLCFQTARFRLHRHTPPHLPPASSDLQPDTPPQLLWTPDPE